MQTPRITARYNRHNRGASCTSSVVIDIPLPFLYGHSSQGSYCTAPPTNALPDTALPVTCAEPERIHLLIPGLLQISSCPDAPPPQGGLLTLLSPSVSVLQDTLTPILLDTLTRRALRRQESGLENTHLAGDNISTGSTRKDSRLPILVPWAQLVLQIGDRRQVAFVAWLRCAL